LTKIEAIRLYRADTGEEVTGKPVPKGVTVKAKVTGVFQASATYWGTLYVAKKPVPTSPSQVVKSFECFKKASPGGSSFTCEKTWTVNYPAGRYYVGFSVLRKIPGAGWYPEARAYIAHDVTEAAPPAPTPPPPAPVEAPPFKKILSKLSGKIPLLMGIAAAIGVAAAGYFLVRDLAGKK